MSASDVLTYAKRKCNVEKQRNREIRTFVVEIHHLVSRTKKTNLSRESTHREKNKLEIVRDAELENFECKIAFHYTDPSINWGWTDGHMKTNIKSRARKYVVESKAETIMCLFLQMKRERERGVMFMSFDRRENMLERICLTYQEGA